MSQYIRHTLIRNARAYVERIEHPRLYSNESETNIESIIFYEKSSSESYTVISFFPPRSLMINGVATSAMDVFFFTNNIPGSTIPGELFPAIFLLIIHNDLESAHYGESAGNDLLVTS